MTIGEAVILGLVQGLTEFIPVSSSGHLILVREFFGVYGGSGLAIDAVLQLATALAIIIFFGQEIFKFIRNQRLVLIILLATIPAGIMGFLLEQEMETIFRSSGLVAGMLIVGSVIMYLAEKYGKGGRELNFKNGFIIGLFQALALVPGISRSGATISGGLLNGLSREEAAKFSFLLALPIICGSGLKKLLDLSVSGAISSLGPELIVGALVAFLSGLVAIHVLIKYLKTHSLTVFIYYRLALAILILLLI